MGKETKLNSDEPRKSNNWNTYDITHVSYDSFHCSKILRAVKVKYKVM